MRIPPRYLIGQALAYAAFAVGIGYFSQAPSYERTPPGQAVIKLSLTHAGQRVDPCHKRTAEELAKLPPNMRAKQSCTRERHPVTIEFMLDGETLFHETKKPAGLSRDGSSRFYHRLIVPAGEHDITFRLLDSGRTDGYDVEVSQKVELEPRQILAVDYDAQAGGVLFR